MPAQIYEIPINILMRTGTKIAQKLYQKNLRINYFNAIEKGIAVIKLNRKDRGLQ